MKIFVKNEASLTELAKLIAPHLKPGDFISLRGTLGMGKTAFARALIRQMTPDGDEIDVPSPTYTLVQQYDTPQGLISHFDLYRLDNPDEIWELGWEEALYDGICFVEWPERAKDHLPEDRLEISLMPSSDPEQSREYLFSFYGFWEARSLDLKHV